ncbi:VIT1/CCC1 transporter family protein [Novosphingobium sp.]|uniref:VIT1/CCC1 transporter family protein n=1 Tax=Novosphingobium sp. TaxID=1874826 RepID=UPI003D0E5E0F
MNQSAMALDTNASKAAVHDEPDHEIGEGHYTNRAGWLRAAVLGANDGLLSTASLMAGVAAASVSPSQLILTGVAGIAAGAMSMAAGEYVSVSSQADSENADLDREKRALERHPRRELDELARIYRERGLDQNLANEVARALTKTDALDAHARDELGITEHNAANPFQAAAASALSFISGGIAPLLAGVYFTAPTVLYALFGVSIAMLAVLGALGARAGGAAILPGVVRVVVFGTLAMAVTAGVGKAFHAVM